MAVPVPTIPPPSPRPIAWAAPLPLLGSDRICCLLLRCRPLWYVFWFDVLFVRWRNGVCGLRTERSAGPFRVCLSSLWRAAGLLARKEWCWEVWFFGCLDVFCGVWMLRRIRALLTPYVVFSTCWLLICYMLYDGETVLDLEWVGGLIVMLTLGGWWSGCKVASAWFQGSENGGQWIACVWGSLLYCSLNWKCRYLVFGVCGLFEGACWLVGCDSDC